MRYLHKITLLAMIFIMATFSFNCGHKRDRSQADTMSAQNQASQSPDARRAGQKPMRKGQGPVAGGRGLGREGGNAMHRTDGIKLTKAEEEAVNIQTIKASLQPLKSQLTAMGKVITPRQSKAIVSYAFPARISEVHVRIGDWVKPGQKLITLQSEEVGNAISDFYKALADHELSRVSHERQQRLFERGVGAKKELLTADADLKVTEASLNAAEKKLHVLGFTEAQIKVLIETHQVNPVISLYAPIAGKIIQNNSVLGSMIDQSNEIMVIMDPTLLWIDAEIYEKDIAKVKRGQPVEIQLPAYPGELFEGKITYISDVMKEETRTVTIRSEVENRENKLKPGMFAEMRIALNKQAYALVVPQEAVLEDKGDKVVFIKRGGQYFLQVIQTGASDNGNVEILRGLVEGDEVVAAGSYQLKSKLYEEILKAGHVH
ncbi:MAG: efflux RND transporter periplasmic adaptor subunit [Candidatus Aminicenantes bacterium]|nr:efflux RND transporter periplasmic adaptor subunit [Candidatus Aminicenantes bacterium]